ncbi:MAG: DNA methyltransferase, partial [Thermoguttaceae bacterium]
MDKTFEQGKDEVAKLGAHFKVNRDEFRACNEAQIRQQLINPLFESLGWDVANVQHIAPQYAEVVTEQSQDDEGPRKAPDYTFRVGTLPKFYVEAKRCSIDIGSDPAPAFQLRRYGWNPPHLLLSLLTNFEEIGVYDCSLRPRQSDKASRARISLFHFQDYADRWRELWDVFSREAVWSGAFDQYALSKRKRGTSEFDEEFLKEIEGWREMLARNIALRNKGISHDDLNAAVQLTIDRVVFLRMAEDQGLEPYQQLLNLCDHPGVFSRFVRKLCQRADEKYNAGLFHFEKEAGSSEAPDRITPKLTIDDKVFKPILQSLYFEHGSPYDFRHMPAEILGTIHERFLGKVIRLTAGHQAKVEKKPELRKAGGVFYTPAYITRYIVTQTVGVKVAGRSPAQLSGGKRKPPVRVLDMACGSGSFLLAAYQCLLQRCLDWYVKNRPEGYPKAVYKNGRTNDWRLTIAEKKRILTTHIFGVDIDAQAVEVTKLSLLLKVLEGETDQSVSQQQRLFHDRALPNLADNIKCGNSLIGPDYFTGRLNLDPEEMKRVNAFDWGQGFPDAISAGGFDCIIGNPPYVRQETLSGLKEYLAGHYEAFDGVADLYAYFMERSVRLLCHGGRFSFIVSSSFLRATYGEPLRRVLKKYAGVLRIVDFGGLAVFENAKDTYVCIPLLQKGEQSPRVEVSRISSPQVRDLDAFVSANCFTIPHERLS